MKHKFKKTLGWIFLIAGLIIMFYPTSTFFASKFLWILLSTILLALGPWMVNKK